MSRPAVRIDNTTWEFDGASEELAASGLTAFQLTVASAHEDTLATLREIERVRDVIEASGGRFVLIERADDLERAAVDGRTGIVLHLQNALPIGDEPGRVETLRRLGVRVVQLTYNERNAVGDGCLEPADAGLSRFGRRLVAELNRRGVLVDLSHVGRRSSLEAIEASDAPCVFSHSNPRSRADNPRNIDDEQMRACAERGGVIGVCGWGPISWTRGAEPPDLDTIADHLDHAAELVGAAHVAIATDAPASGRTDRIMAHFQEINDAYPDVTGAFIAAFGNDLRFRYPLPLRRLPDLAERLTGRGWPEDAVRGAMGENMLRVYRQAWAPGDAA